jgi:aspartyl-tRNA(Asn)/glutamyl-tRNA(Gln) amidotransferase subunit C
MAEKINLKLVEELAHLARLEFDAQSREEILSDLKRMLDFVDKLNELDTTGVEPLIYMSDEKNVLRKDVPGDGISKEEALKNAPLRDTDYFKVPKVIEQGR